ncbi:hypothetical protein A1232T_01927 [Psychrobacter piechaudii]|uniref:Uncharacterized protein n=1 Tax=Psychrobacter piechaudii TaxID=1945521 RepID=A0A1R4GXD1_9GAMM|nr:hypothetical protein A1232T_01927 [Psychrobacter piechaudii]
MYFKETLIINTEAPFRKIVTACNFNSPFTSTSNKKDCTLLLGTALLSSL